MTVRDFLVFHLYIPGLDDHRQGLIHTNSHYDVELLSCTEMRLQLFNCVVG